MTIENDAPKIYPIGSAEGLAEAERRIAEAKRTGATELDLGGLGLEEVPSTLPALEPTQDALFRPRQSRKATAIF